MSRAIPQTRRAVLTGNRMVSPPSESKPDVHLSARFELGGFLGRTSGAFDSDLRLVENGNLHRGCNEAEVVGLLVELQRARLIAARGDGDDRPQSHALKHSTTVWSEQQCATGVVLVGDDVDLRPRAEGEITEQMTRRERGDEKIFRIVDIGVAAEHRVGAP